MNTLSIVGFVCLFLLAGYLTIAAAAAWLSEIAFSGKGVFGPVLAVVAVGLWAIVWQVNPFTISVGIA